MNAKSDQELRDLVERFLSCQLGGDATGASACVLNSKSSQFDRIIASIPEDQRAREAPPLTLFETKFDGDTATALLSHREGPASTPLRLPDGREVFVQNSGSATTSEDGSQVQFCAVAMEAPAPWERTDPFNSDLSLVNFQRVEGRWYLTGVGDADASKPTNTLNSSVVVMQRPEQWDAYIQTSRKSCDDSNCLNNLRTVGNAVLVHTFANTDWKLRLTSDTWEEAVRNSGGPAFERSEIFRCPATGKAYTLNESLYGANLGGPFAEDQRRRVVVLY